MPYDKLNISGAKADILSWAGHDLTLEEQNMLRNVSRLPCIYRYVALMPDAHLGKGSMVGSVIATKDAVIPATVGVDIGCGMAAIKTPFKSSMLEGKLKDLRLKIEEAIPVGFNFYKDRLTNLHAGTAGMNSTTCTKACGNSRQNQCVKWERSAAVIILSRSVSIPNKMSG